VLSKLQRNFHSPISERITDHTDDPILSILKYLEFQENKFLPVCFVLGDYLSLPKLNLLK
jgi:hypothetical protein